MSACIPRILQRAVHLPLSPRTIVPRLSRSVQTEPPVVVAAPPPPVQPVFVPSANVEPVVVHHKGPGFFRGGIIGFLLGITLAGGTAYVYLLDDYQQSSQSLLASVEDLQKSTNKLKDHTRKIEVLEKDQKSLVAKAATKEDLEQLRSELLKVIDDVNLSHLELKTQVWEVAQDVKGSK
ncbi:hypothetical protein HK097_005088 [Rhizophlyctis rosea]|uniref:Uncharacterized protein n=1 Tax=Rhizophlyctis rosea TaxID=64517 RepID=A0AAD5SR30_9FUNG|nr:hypothetical protein HK097_005088 [Rhizophlyctis rosea]